MLLRQLRVCWGVEMSRKILANELQELAVFVREATGIELDERKAYLFETRLGPLLEDMGFEDYLALLRKAKVDHLVKRALVDAITTQETSFFRDQSPFDLMKYKIVPEFFEKNGMTANFRVWSAASSTGQEVYSLAMLLQDLLFDLSKYNINLLATDISDAAIASASMGKYTKFELARGLDFKKLSKYFDQVGSNWKIKDEIRQLVKFKKVNLLEPFIGIPQQDVIFCRNVAIYFSRENRSILYDRLADSLKPGGVLVISSTESLLGISERFEKQTFRNAVYYVKR